MRFLRDVKAVPIAANDDQVDVALIDPLDPYPLEALAFALGRKIRPLIAKANDLEAALDRLYGAAAQAQSSEETVDEADVERLKDLAERRAGRAHGQQPDRARVRSARLGHPYRAGRGLRARALPRRRRAASTWRPCPRR